MRTAIHAIPATVLLLVPPFLFVGCAGGSEGREAASAGDTSPAEEAVAGETADDNLAVVPDLPPEVGYPPEPYGYTEGQTVADLSFYEPETGDTIHLHQWYQDPKVKLLMLVSTAAW